ncbi:hypothetical protein ILUMI_00383 [Ignelater luminosus]|uniref:Peptidase S1 domain-containing protein n=1 Tax=Ignelater luminosus TaxID=2038154 RepID=A0A8K0GQA2_IGNLU|nr:hypothetical protein ILUMI_00383 [Ignelater luminosus]
MLSFNKRYFVMNTLKVITVIVLILTVNGIYGKLSYSKTNATNWLVIGGFPARDGQYPYQVSLRNPSDNRHFCSGSIVRLYWVLTAGHCVDNRNSSSVVIVVGTNHLDENGTKYEVSNIVLHEEYNGYPNYTNDIALLKIRKRISYSSKVRPVSLGNINIAASTSCTLSGWGFTTSSSLLYPNELQHVTLTTISNIQCQEALYPYSIQTSNLCTYENGKRACNGDSGSPLMCRGQQHGIVSWGKNCNEGNPDVYTNVPYYREWIRNKTGA